MLFRSTDLTPEVAGILATHIGSHLFLPSISKVSAEVAKALANHKGYLSLDGLSTLQPEVAEALATRKCSTLLENIEDYDIEEGEVDEFLEMNDAYKDSVLYLTSDAAVAVARHGEDPAKSGVGTPTEETTFVFAKCKSELSLGGLTEIPSDLEDVLSNHEGDIYLNGLTSLTSVPLALKLARTHSHKLSLGGLTEVRPEIAAALAKIGRAHV